MAAQVGDGAATHAPVEAPVERHTPGPRTRR
jgi:hypothetical protein